MSYLDTQRCDRDNRGLGELQDVYTWTLSALSLSLYLYLSFRTELTFGEGLVGKWGGVQHACLKELLPDSIEHVRSCTSFF